MSDVKEHWWSKRTPRSVDYLKLWKENPRFDTAESESRISDSDFAEEVISEPADKKSFYGLITSIVKLGFIDFEPIVVWKNDQDRYVVAEGNRRVLALKLLRNPHKAPKSIRGFILQQSKLINRDSIEKIQVCVAPNEEATHWYVLQRHSTSSNQKPWQRLQQQRFIVSLYDEYEHDIEKVKEVTGFTRSEIISALRYVQLRDLATRDEVIKLMTEEEKELIYGYRISMTVLERWFSNEEVRERWGIKFDNMKVTITSNESSFLHAYGHFLKLMFNIVPNDLKFVVNTRSIPERNEEIFAVLPEVTFPEQLVEQDLTQQNQQPNGHKDTGTTKPSPDSQASPTQNSNPANNNQIEPVPHNNNRARLVLGYQQISVKSPKLNSLFRELKAVPIKLYVHVTSISLRTFLDLAVDDFIQRKNLTHAMATKLGKDYTHTILQQRLKFLSNDHISCAQANKVISKLLQPSNEHSLDTLNSFVHGHETHKIDHRFLNGFWDMLAPLLKVLVDLKDR
ncbi:MULTISPECIES: ParB N-terminal domain-containing protein [Pseudomonadati]|uniref:ParB N-terminal domain-containing protein n=1 Tax=Pseudomonadati TaxID=3379134 RepID=UPI003A8FC80D